MTRKNLTASLLALTCALALASTSLAGGERKNQRPFVNGKATSAVIESAPSPEAKNELPFTRSAERVAASTAVADESDVISRHLDRQVR